MGQKGSSLKRKTRGVKKDAQSQADVDESFSPIASSENECAGLSSSIVHEKEDAQLQINFDDCLSLHSFESIDDVLSPSFEFR